MATKMLTRLVTSIATVCLIALGQVPAFAAEKKLEEITVMAPRITSEQRTSPPYGKTIVANKSARVDISDLDISRTADMNEVRNRVEEAAQRICKQLSDELPFGQPDTPECVRRAVSDAMAQVEEVALQS